MKPIIDIHAHIFNAMDIPLKGYLLSRRDKKGLEGIMIPVLGGRLAACLRRKLKPQESKNIFDDIKTIACNATMEFVYAFLGEAYRSWAETLSKEVIDITSELVETFEKDEINLYVPLVIDYEYWFKSTHDNPLKGQINHIYDQIVLPYEGKIHPFAPFDPARELAYRKNMLDPDGKPEEHGSLNLVKEAIEEKGFIGVKLYNSLGYRPFNNQTVDKKRRKIGLHKKMGYLVFKGEEYDEVLSELYEYCIENEVPITAHCVMDGIESYSKASWDFGQAAFWRDVLSQESFRNLHLNLAHFGWHKKEGYHSGKNWVRDICELLDGYEYLFTDVSHHSVVSDKYIERFKSDYRDMCRDFPVVKKRLLFGIDWHVIKRLENFGTFKEKYFEVLKNEGLFSDEQIEDFLGGNALRFLGLLPGGKNRERLENFYEKNEIDPPKWFKDTANSNNDDQ
jgi:predicted TIM-barrel fold metal-dependent hydrolase